VGREEEIAAVGALLRDPDVHLVTLTGPGGIGKTRLALEVARAMATAVPADLDGVSFLDLVSVRDAAGWPGAVTAALKIEPASMRHCASVQCRSTRRSGSQVCSSARLATCSAPARSPMR
jgi:predicted ATPase